MITDEKYRIWLTDEEMDVLRPFLPTPRGKQRVDDKRVFSGIIFVLKTGYRWRDAPECIICTRLFTPVGDGVKQTRFVPYNVTALYDKHPEIFLSTCALAVIVMF